MQELKLESYLLNYLDHLHNTINRMATSSRSMKQFSFALFTGTAVLSSTIDFTYGWVVIVPLLCLWWLDAFYLSVQRNVRKSYNDVATELKKELKTQQSEDSLLLQQLYNFKSSNYKSPAKARSCMWNISTTPIYLPQIIIIWLLTPYPY